MAIGQWRSIHLFKMELKSEIFLSCDSLSRKIWQQSPAKFWRVERRQDLVCHDEGCNGLIRGNSGHALKLYRDTLCQEERERTYQLRSQVFVSMLNGVFIVTKWCQLFVQNFYCCSSNLSIPGAEIFQNISRQKNILVSMFGAGGKLH